MYSFAILVSAAAGRAMPHCASPWPRVVLQVACPGIAGFEISSTLPSQRLRSNINVQKSIPFESVNVLKTCPAAPVVPTTTAAATCENLILTESVSYLARRKRRAQHGSLV